MDNDEDILAQISLLAGQINRHKNAQQLNDQTQYNLVSRGSGRGGVGSFGAYNKHSTDGTGDYPQATSGWRGRGGYSSRGYTRGGRPQAHRHRSLILNGSTASSNLDNPSRDTPSFITKTDRHLQLINTSIYEKESQSRAKAMEETKKLKLKQRDEHEKAKLNKHFYRSSGHHSYSAAPRSASTTGKYELDVQGIRFYVTKDGSKLVKVPGEDPYNIGSLDWVQHYPGHYSSPLLGDLNSAKATPKTVLVGGVKFHRSKNGNLIRNGVIQANRKTGIVKKVNVPCTVFGTTGSCPKGPQCRYIHDPSKVAVCKVFLMKGSCPSGDSCDLSHDLAPERTPPCVHFSRGNCSNPDCRFTHVRVSPSAQVCRPFGMYGYCERGLKCDERHVHECPDFSNTGKCTTKGCRLPHREKASIMRTNSATAEEDSDIASDEDEADIDSDDVDSDDFDEEFMGGDDDGKPDLAFMQQDFVQFTESPI